MNTEHESIDQIVSRGEASERAHLRRRAALIRRSTERLALALEALDDVARLEAELAAARTRVRLGHSRDEDADL